jgi:putative heme-binding domain-containing protein
MMLAQVTLSQENPGAIESISLQSTPDEIKAYEKFAMTTAGVVQKGRQLFFDDQRTKCSTCHRVEDKGNLVGPELTHIGGKFDRPHLIESLLEPSRQIVEGFRSTVFLMKEGQVVTGVVKQRTSEHIHLLGADGNAMVVDVVSVESEKSSEVSIMPSGIAGSLSASEFADLIAFLESLRSGPQKHGAGITGPIELPKGFTIHSVATGLTGAVALDLAPDGRIFVCEQTGALRVIQDGRLLPEPFVTLPVQAEWERGLIGITIDPDFANKPYVYVCYVAKEPYIHHVVSRFIADGNVARSNSEQILLSGDDQATLGGKVPAGHQGGALHFGPDGCLYIAIGEQTAELPSQRLDTFQGKLLRIHPDGTIPQDNPLAEKTTGKYRAIWAYGLRNPFTFAIQRSSGDILINDVGGTHEEINRGIAGGNYGWPEIDHGPTDNPNFVSPIHIYPQASISGGDFVPDNSPWPAKYRGKYLFADFVRGWIHSIDPSTADCRKSNAAEKFAEGFRRPVDLRFASDGRLYVLLRNAWVVDGKFEGGTSSLLSIQYGN